MTRRDDDTPSDRRWSDRPGTRRASVEHGGRSAGRRPRTDRPRQQTSMGRMSESRGQRLARRLSATGRFAVRHRGSLTCLVGAFGTVVSLLLLEGTVQLISGVLTLGIAGAGAAVHHHQRNKTLNSARSRRASRAEAKAHHDAMLRTGRPAAAPEPGGNVITVKSHTRDGTDGVKTHTRKKAGAGGGEGGAKAS